jgi:hypothetical protein
MHIGSRKVRVNNWSVGHGRTNLYERLRSWQGGVENIRQTPRALHTSTASRRPHRNTDRVSISYMGLAQDFQWLPGKPAVCPTLDATTHSSFNQSTMHCFTILPQRIISGVSVSGTACAVHLHCFDAAQAGMCFGMSSSTKSIRCAVIIDLNRRTYGNGRTLQYSWQTSPHRHLPLH